MFQILDKNGQIVDDATSLIQAQDVVTYLTNRKRENAPYHCRPAA